ncbi:hypothetical protein K470DRAFT_257710 [Piedraia hortae CBS 480.64]|uniref:DNA-directed RNA polymerase subunit n=1 Tax=Piedraia hortae CBS 480.64 TaxID=1314780 RepID=A0A6A7C0E5_9PEZI|nr:hypothetical protein K470DRAFT_257710 [Piedraia hortae CBS 480.64]
MSHEPGKEKKRKRKEKDSGKEKSKKRRTAATVDTDSEPPPDRAKTNLPAKSHKESRKKLKRSPFKLCTVSLYLGLSPCAYAFPVQGLIAEHIAPLLLTYYPPLQGVVLSFSNVSISEQLDEVAGQNINDVEQTEIVRHTDPILTKSSEYCTSYAWLTATFLVFRPFVGCVLSGAPALQNESFLGLVCFNYFNAAVEKSELPEGWKYTGEEWVDEDGEKIKVPIEFKVKEVEWGFGGHSGSVNLVGSIRELRK